MAMDFLLDALRPSDWEQVRSIYLERFPAREEVPTSAPHRTKAFSHLR
jgi:hypothetical protein